MAYSVEQIGWIQRTRALTGAPQANSNADAGSGPGEPGSALAPAPTPVVANSVGEQLRTAVQTFLGAFTELPISGANWEVAYNGKTTRLTPKERDAAIDALAVKLLKIGEEGLSRVTWAESLYAEQKKVDAEWWLTAHVVQAFGRVSDPGPLLKKACARAKSHCAAAGGAAQSRDLEALALAVTDCLSAAREAELLAKAYFEGTIDAAEFQVKVLEGVVTASKYTLLALSILATGGASAEAAGIISSVSSTAMDVTVDLGLGKEVDWGKVTVSVVMELVMLRYGKGLEHALKAEVAKRLVKSGAHIGEAVLTKVFTEIFKVAMSNAAQGAIKALQGKEVTNKEVAEEAAKDLASPGSLATEVLKALREAALIAKAAA